MFKVFVEAAKHLHSRATVMEAIKDTCENDKEYIRAPIGEILLDQFKTLGLAPKNDSFVCKTVTCRELQRSNGTEALYFLENDTKSLVIDSSEYTWEMERTSFIVDLGLHCKKDGAKVTLISSMYFVGAVIGSLVSAYILDNFGRKKSCIIGSIGAVLGTLVGTFCKSYSLLLIVRIMQGIGNFIVTAGCYVLLLEILPAKLRNYANGYGMVLWALGYPTASLIAYLIHNWNYLFLASSIFTLTGSISIFFMIEPPRYFLVCNDLKKAELSLQKLAAMTSEENNINSVNLEDEIVRDRQTQGIMQQFKELTSYPIMFFELLVQMFIWFVCALSFFGFNFGWSAILPDIYISYVLAAVGEIIAYVTSVSIIQALGRRRGMIVFLGGAIASYVLAVIDYDIGNGYTVESVSCLVGLIFVSAAFAGIFFYTAELAPTSHRGLFFALCSSSGRIGSFLGPYVIGYLFKITHKAIPLGILAFLCFLAAFGILFLVETGDMKIPDVPAEVIERRKNFRVF